MTRTDLTRRRLLAAGGLGAAGLVVPGAARATARTTAGLRRRHGSLPAHSIQDILGLDGSVTAGVLSMQVERKDIGDVRGPKGVTFKPSFEIQGDLTFQPLSNSLAFFNGDLALKPSELNPVVDAILAGGLRFQAMHQHYFDLDPMVWFVHFRAVGEPLRIARAVRKVLAATATPLPQKMPSDPKTPLNHGKLAKTLHGTSEIGEDGVVTVSVTRKGTVVVDDVVVSPEANISTNIQFLPLDASGTRAAVAPDFSMTVSEVASVCRTMRKAGFEIGCLYNQETGEHPQLYFAHMLAVGDPQHLAVAVRAALDHTNSD